MTLMFKRRSMLAGAGALAAASAFPLSAARAQTILRYGNAGGPQTLSNTFNAKLSDTLS